MRASVWPGKPYPLGATHDGYGTNFALFSSVAERVELCVFDDADHERRHDLVRGVGHVWHAFLPGVQPGTRYGYRVHGPWQPWQGLRCNPSKLVLDPYARALSGRVRWTPAIMGYRGDPLGPRSTEDSAAATYRAVVAQPHFDWGNDRPLDVPWSDTIIYECHVKGMTVHCRDVPPAQRGTYAGLAHPATIAYLERLGVTAVELLPVYAFAPARELVERGLTDYWGYSPVAYFAPHSAYASVHSPLGVVAEFKHMVRALHHAGIEVMLDVVYSHTGEGDQLGPTLSLRGIDNCAYYDTTGAGDMLQLKHPNVLQLVMDSLRYWIEDMHVDGFRFDRATLRTGGALFELVQQDPVVSSVKLIADDGCAPPLWAERSRRYRDRVRDFWRGRSGTLLEPAESRATIHYVTSHDGFTLRDLVTYGRKHNDANREGNRDGEDDNRSWNCGVEGASSDPAIEALRARQQRNLLATLLLSPGVPMLSAGDELGRTQGGNNHAYCQDNRTTWLDWDHLDIELLSFVQQLVELRRAHPVFRGDHGLAPLPGRDDRDGSSAEIVLAGGGETFLLLLHARRDDRTFVLPAVERVTRWQRVLDTARGFPDGAGELYNAGATVDVCAWSLWLLAGR